MRVPRYANGSRDLFTPSRVVQEMLSQLLPCHRLESVAELQAALTGRGQSPQENEFHAISVRYKIFCKRPSAVNLNYPRCFDSVHDLRMKS